MKKWTSRLSEKDELDHRMMVEWSKESLRRTRFAYPANLLGAGPKITVVDYLGLNEVIELADKVQAWPRKGPIGEYIGKIDEFMVGIRRDREYDEPSGRPYYTLGCAAIDNKSLFLLARYYTVLDDQRASLDRIYLFAEKSFRENIPCVDSDENKIRQAVKRAKNYLGKIAGKK